MISKESDKIYWHKYVDFYKEFLPENTNNILEIGVFQGDSIRYWNDLYPNANIFGIDIIEEQNEWPKKSNITYYKLDQSNEYEYKKLLGCLDLKFDVLIEDGSHDPLHQKISLVESIDFMSEESIYILEDIHTSHHQHAYYQDRLDKLNKNRFFGSKKNNRYLMPLQALLLLQHVKENDIDINSINDKVDFTKSLFSFEELKSIYLRTKSIHFFKRNTLPNYCYSCKTNDFDYINQKCACGTDLMAEADSMTVVLKF